MNFLPHADNLHPEETTYLVSFYLFWFLCTFEFKIIQYYEHKLSSVK